MLLVEDGSAGSAGAVAAQVGDSRVRLLRNSGRRGAAATRNVGIQAARGRWLAFCDDDDIWAPGKLAAQLDALAAAGTGWSCTAEVTVDADLRIIGQRRLTQENLALLRYGNMIPGGGSSVVAHADLVRTAGGFDETLSNAEDWDLWIRLAARSELAIVDRPLLAYREWRLSKSTNVRGLTRCYDTVLSRYGALPLPPDRAYARARYLARQKMRARQRLRSSAAYLALAIRHRTHVDCIRAVGALAAPRAVERVEYRRGRRRVPTSWLAEVEGWLAFYRPPVVSRTARYGESPVP